MTFWCHKLPSFAIDGKLKSPMSKWDAFMFTFTFNNSQAANKNSRKSSVKLRMHQAYICCCCYSCKLDKNSWRSTPATCLTTSTASLLQLPQLLSTLQLILLTNIRRCMKMWYTTWFEICLGVRARWHFNIPWATIIDDFKTCCMIIKKAITDPSLTTPDPCHLRRQATYFLKSLTVMLQPEVEWSDA